ncbi:sodium/hydrogen exchanger, partial [Genlisea aurea]
SLGTSASVSATFLGLVLVGRAAFVFPLSYLSNLTKKNHSERISFRQQFIIWWAGLMRGAVSVALAYNQFTTTGRSQERGSAVMITSTITVVLFSTVVFGLMTKPLIRCLMPPSKQLNRMISTEPVTPSSVTVPLIVQDSVSELFNDHGHRGSGGGILRPNSLRMLLTKPSKTVHYYWRKFDDAVMRPIFGGRGFVPYVPGSPTEQSLPH